MMAPEPTPPPTTLDADMLGELREMLVRYLREGNHTEEMQDILRRVNEQAHERGISAEQVLIALKRVWFSLPEVRNAGESEPQRSLLHRVVTRCIQQYYAR